MEYSLEASLSLLGIGAKETLTLKTEIENSMSSTEEKYWSKETDVSYTAPAGKTYRVVQLVLDFDSPLEVDNCSLYTKECVEESN